MGEKNKKKFIDRLQFLGVIGPFVILLTLFAVLTRGSMKGWYLFLTTLLGLPLCWKWSTKGFLTTLAILVVIYVCMLPLFPVSEALWQAGASLSLSIGLFTTLLGFEEIKEMMLDLQIESQSRLDNLIELDDKFNSFKKDWDLSEESYQTQIRDKDYVIEKLSNEAGALEKTLSLIEGELKLQQQKSEGYVKELELVGLEKSELEVKTIQMSQELKEIRQELSLSLTEREKEYIAANQSLEEKLIKQEAQLFDLEEKLSEQEEYENNLSHKTSGYELNIKKLEENLRDKVSEIYELRNQMGLREVDITKQKDEIDSFVKKISEKEHELLSYKAQITERDKKINQISTKLRDLEQDLHLARSKIEEQKDLFKLTEKKLFESDNLLEALALENSKKITLKDKEIENLYNELEEKGNRVNELMERNKEVDSTISLYEEQVLELREQIEEDKRVQFKEITKLNEARFALFQANLDIERYKKELSDKPVENINPAPNLPRARKHWLFQVEDILKKDRLKKMDLEQLPKHLVGEIVTLNQSKALYKQLRQQFEEKSRSLDEAREKLFKTETQYEKLLKKHEQEMSEESKIESELEKSLFVKEEEITIVEDEIKDLNSIIQSLLEELNQYEVLES